MANTIEKLRVSGITHDLIDATAIHSLDGYATTGDVTAATAAVVQTIAGYGYQTSGDVENIVSGKADTSAVTNSLAAKYGAVEYDSNTKHINFYADSTTGTVLSYVDATDFIKDGMVDNVEITTKYAGWSEVEDWYNTKFNTTNSVRVYFSPNCLHMGFGVEINPTRLTEYPCANNVIQYDDQNEKWTQNLTKGGRKPYMIEYHSGETSNDNYVEITNQNVSDPTYACIIEEVDVSFCIDSVVMNGPTDLQKVEYMDYTIVPVLRITFNSDAGKEQIDIPLTDIFDASNYFTSAQTEAYVSGYTYDKQTIDNKIGQGGTFDPTQYYTKSQTSGATELSTAFSGKQDTVYVSGTTLIIS